MNRFARVFHWKRYTHLSANMTIKQFVEYAYNLFSNFDKPMTATDVDHFPECWDHNNEICGADRRELSPEQIGTVCWGISDFLTPMAMGYYIHRFIELAITAQNDKHGDPYMCSFINQIGLSSKSEQFSPFSKEQRQAVSDSLKVLKEKYFNILKEHCWEDEIDNAIEQWST